MRILIPVDPEFPVPPKLYGGVERLVDGLITAYSQRGHDVFLLGNPESTSKKAKEIFRWKGLASRGASNVVRNASKLFTVVSKIKPDIIHSFARLLYTYPVLLSSSIPFVQTYGRRISPYSTGMASFVGGKRMNFTCCGKHMLSHLNNVSKFTAVYNFTDVNYFVPDDGLQREHLMFLGRIEEIKGTKEAVEVALRTGDKLAIAGNIQPGHDAYFEKFIKPHRDNPLIEYVGPVDDEQKRRYLQEAKAFLFPIKWEEPFGIVMVEAMACGAPVIGFRRGSVPEVIDNGRTGFVVDDVNGMVEAIDKIDRIDRVVVRKECVRRFSLDVICDQYLELFERVLYQ